MGNAKLQIARSELVWQGSHLGRRRRQGADNASVREISVMSSDDRSRRRSQEVKSVDERVSAYIDGLNLSSAIRDAGLVRYLWLDLVALARELLRPHQRLESVHYFTALLNRNEQAKRQDAFLEANKTSRELTVREGEFQFNSKSCGACQKPLGCTECGSSNKVPVEKQSDVSLGTQLGLDAGRDRFDTALIVSTDSDFVGAIRLVREAYPEKRIIVALPPGRYERARDLLEAATGSYMIWPSSLKRAQLPDTVQIADGQSVHRPSAWTLH